MDTQKFVRKPLYVDGVRVTAQNFEEVATWCQGEIQQEGHKKFIRVRVSHPKKPRQTQAFFGDWVLWTEFGGYKVYTNHAFRQAFDQAPEQQSAQVTQQNVTVVNAEPEIKAGVGLTEAEAREAAGLPSAAQEEAAEAYTPVAPVPGSTGAAVEDTPTAPPVVEPSWVDKRVLSIEEQNEMGPDAVRELIRSGEVVLAQDVAA